MKWKSANRPPPPLRTFPRLPVAPALQRDTDGVLGMRAPGALRGDGLQPARGQAPRCHAAARNCATSPMSRGHAAATQYRFILSDRARLRAYVPPFQPRADYRTDPRHDFAMSGSISSAEPSYAAKAKVSLFGNYSSERLASGPGRCGGTSRHHGVRSERSGAPGRNNFVCLGLGGWPGRDHPGISVVSGARYAMTGGNSVEPPMVRTIVAGQPEHVLPIPAPTIMVSGPAKVVGRRSKRAPVQCLPLPARFAHKIPQR